jgi:hypothetical protein
MPVKQALRLWGATALALSVVISASAGAKPKRRKSKVVFSDDWREAPSAKYGAMDAARCRAELAIRKIRFTPVPEAPGVLAPVRIPEGVGGVRFHTLLPEKKRRSSPWEVFDCRLVLALHDFSSILRAHRIDDVVIFSAWRPPPKSWPEDKLGRRHPGALAVDIMRMRQQPEEKAEKKANGPARGDAPAANKAKTTKAKPTDEEPTDETPSEPVWIDVKKDFHGRIGDRTCGPKGRGPRRKTPESEELRAIVCEAAGKRIFTSMLTPNYDRHHHDHLHLEVTPKVKWRMVR